MYSFYCYCCGKGLSYNIYTIIILIDDDPGVEGSLILHRNGIDSPVHSSGIVVLYHGGQWGNICRLSSFTIVEAGVICHQLSYTGASSWSYGDNHR